MKISNETAFFLDLLADSLEHEYYKQDENDCNIEINNFDNDEYSDELVKYLLSKYSGLYND